MKALSLDRIASAYPDFPMEDFEREGSVLTGGQVRHYTRSFGANLYRTYDYSLTAIAPRFDKPWKEVSDRSLGLVLRQEVRKTSEPYRNWIVGSEIAIGPAHARIYMIHAPPRVNNAGLRKQLEGFDDFRFSLVLTTALLGKWGVGSVRLDDPDMHATRYTETDASRLSRIALEERMEPFDTGQYRGFLALLDR